MSARCGAVPQTARHQSAVAEQGKARAVEALPDGPQMCFLRCNRSEVTLGHTGFGSGIPVM